MKLIIVALSLITTGFIEAASVMPEDKPDDVWVTQTHQYVNPQRPDERLTDYYVTKDYDQEGIITTHVIMTHTPAKTLTTIKVSPYPTTNPNDYHLTIEGADNALKLYVAANSGPYCFATFSPLPGQKIEVIANSGSRVAFNRSSTTPALLKITGCRATRIHVQDHKNPELPLFLDLQHNSHATINSHQAPPSYVRIQRDATSHATLGAHVVNLADFEKRVPISTEPRDQLEVQRTRP